MLLAELAQRVIKVDKPHIYMQDESKRKASTPKEETKKEEEKDKEEESEGENINEVCCHDN